MFRLKFNSIGDNDSKHIYLLLIYSVRRFSIVRTVINETEREKERERNQLTKMRYQALCNCMKNKSEWNRDVDVL